MNEKICKATRRPHAFRGPAMSAALMLCLISTASLRAECPADLDGSGTVSGSDLGMFLAEWGSPGGPADFNQDGIVDGADMGALLSSWGLCPCEEGIEYTPIHDGTEALEPDVVEYTESAMITRLADRARDRHARKTSSMGRSSASTTTGFRSTGNNESRISKSSTEPPWGEMGSPSTSPPLTS